jgi:DNA-binding NarL/FixJ family response regulator
VIRVVVVDVHAIVRRGLQDLLAGAAVDAHEPDVVLTDLGMPAVVGLGARLSVCARRPGTRVVVLSHSCDPQGVLDAIDAGAAGYLLKDAEPAELVQGVRAAAAGEAPLSPQVARTLLELGAQRCRAGKLTPRGRQVLALLGQGLTNRAVARRLGITEKTVERHLAVVSDRIGVGDRDEAARCARARSAWLDTS